MASFASRPMNLIAVLAIIISLYSLSLLHGLTSSANLKHELRQQVFSGDRGSAEEKPSLKLITQDSKTGESSHAINVKPEAPQKIETPPVKNETPPVKIENPPQKIENPPQKIEEPPKPEKPKKSETAVKAVAKISDRAYHTVTSAQGSAVHWQCRVHYYWYLKQKAICERDGPCDIGGWTRLLHSGVADDLMNELPTMVVDPLPQDQVEHSWYVVLNRPYAFVQWVERAKIPERFVLMAEPDHVWIRPIPNLMKGDTPAAFPFFYIDPVSHMKITKRFAGDITREQASQIAHTGNSPTFMTFEDMKRAMRPWMNTSIAIFTDKEASKEWGWVQEMYGFTITLYNIGIKHVDTIPHFMAQPPWESTRERGPGQPYYIIHYTYGMDYTLDGKLTPGKYGEWRFDKRSFGQAPIPRNLGEPPEGCTNELVRLLIQSFNEATAAIPCWDEYALTGVAPKDCKEEPSGFLAHGLTENDSI